MGKLEAGFEPPQDWVRRFESRLGDPERSALTRLAERGVDRDLRWDLWCWTHPEMWNEIENQSAQGAKTFRREIARFEHLARDLKSSVEPRLLQAVTFFRLPTENSLSALAEQVQSGIAELDRLCAIYTNRRKLAPRPKKTQYDFVDPLIQSVRIRCRHKRREQKPWTEDLARVLNAAVNAHNWTVRKKAAEFRGDSIRRYLERHRMAVKPQGH